MSTTAGDQMLPFAFTTVCRTVLAPALLAGLSLGVTAAAAETKAPSLEALIEKFQGEAPNIEPEVRIDAWVERGKAADRPNELVVTLVPGGRTRLNADPGITITPTERPGVDWLVALPFRHQDQTISYFDPEAVVRMPFAASDDRPLDILVEYAYCLVDYQCFFGEETLSVALTP